MTSNTLELQNLIEGFQLSCQTEGKSPKTIEWYTSFVTRFRLFLELNNLPSQIDKISKNHIRQFILYLQEEARTPHSGKNLSGATIQGYARALKAFFSWADREGYISFNQMAKIPVPKAPVKIINTLTTEQINGLVNTCRNYNGNGQRDLIILLEMLAISIPHRLYPCL